MFGCVVFETCERTDRQTDRHTDALIALPGSRTEGDVINLRIGETHQTTKAAVIADARRISTGGVGSIGDNKASALAPPNDATRSEARY